MVGGSSLNTRVGHTERLDGLIDLSVKVDLAHIGMVGVDDPIRVIDGLQAIERAYFRLNGNSLIHRSNSLNLALVISIQAVALHILLRLAEAHANASTQPDIPATGLFNDNVTDGLEQDCIGLAAEQRETVMGSQHIHGLIRLNHAHVHLAQLFLRHLI